MSRDPTLYLRDIQESCEKIEDYTEGMSKVEFEEDTKTLEAVAWNLVVIGEAVTQLPGEVTNERAEVEWRKIAGLRDVLVHGYFGLDTDIVWDVVENKVRGLHQVMLELLEEKGST